jgi:hypothetical protein
MYSSLKIIVLSEDLILWYYVLSLCLYMFIYVLDHTSLKLQHCDYDVHVLNYALSNKWFELNWI